MKDRLDCGKLESGRPLQNDNFSSKMARRGGNSEGYRICRSDGLRAVQNHSEFVYSKHAPPIGLDIRIHHHCCSRHVDSEFLDEAIIQIQAVVRMSRLISSKGHCLQERTKTPMLPRRPSDLYPSKSSTRRDPWLCCRQLEVTASSQVSMR
jgi:hypothetical protein